MDRKIPVIILICLVCAIALGQNNRQPGSHFAKITPAGEGKVDLRVDNMGYWKRMADSGYVEVSPADNIPSAYFTGSILRGRSVMSGNSTDVPLNDPAFTESENSIFVDPNDDSTLLSSNNSTPYPVIGLFGANYLITGDGGETWGGSAGGPGGSNSGDPAAVIGLDGDYFIGFINSGSGQSVSISTDGGVSWTRYTVSTAPSGGLLDKNHLWIDNKTSSPYEGYLYDAWTVFGGTYDTEIGFKRSTNGGTTWSAQKILSSAINAGSHNQGVNLCTGPSGEVYAVWAVYDNFPADETALGFAKSTNGGNTFASATRIISDIRGIRYSETSKYLRVNSFPSMAVDISAGPNSGNIYVVWPNIGVPGVNTGNDIDIYMIRSTNGGTSWSAPVRVNQDPSGLGKEHFMSWITCDPETGYLAVVYYDDRNVGPAQCEVYASISFDAGNTWEDIKISDVAFTPAPIPGLASDYMGDYIGVTSRGGNVYPVWGDNRTGGFVTYISPFQVNLLPDADFTADKTKACPEDTISFQDLSWKFPTSWQWTITPPTVTYVNGTSSTDQNPKIVFDAPGDYTVKLLVSNSNGNDSLTQTDYISVAFAHSDFIADIRNAVVNVPVTFTDKSSCNILSWEWDFGTGAVPATASGQGPHSVYYTSAGDKTVTLTINGDISETKTGYLHILPPVFLMTDGEVRTCTGTFYDSQGTSPYNTFEDYVYTFYPGSPGQAVQAVFSSFDVEPQDNCLYDFLSIFDGTSISGNLIGTYCGTTSPGTVTATNALGALTFHFHSDNIYTYDGWQAAISCIPFTPAYCTASGVCDEFISNVIIGSINNSSGCSGSYSDYTSLSTLVSRNGSYALSVTNGPPSYTGDECAVWVDWNQDMTFGDQGEAINVSGGPTNFTANIVPPHDAAYGAARMRVRIYYSGSDIAEPCGAATWGEVEDYTLYVAQAGLWVGGTPGQEQNWGTASNWDDNTVPTATTNVIIPTGRTYYPSVAGTHSCNDLDIQDGALVTVNSTGNLTLNGKLKTGQGSSGTLIINGGDCQVYGNALSRLGSNIQVKNGGTLTQN